MDHARGRRGPLTLALCLLAVAAAMPVAAQSAGPAPEAPTRVVTLRVDNDAFDFWEPPWDRPDEDYTDGVRLIIDNAWRPWWASHLWTQTPRCAGAATPCTTTQAWIGQDMYTPERNEDESLITVGARPSAGWLYYGEELRKVSTHDAQLLDLTFGVTGPPSLGQVTQTLAHSLAPLYNRPIDWRHQIPFEPGVIATYERDERLTVAVLGPWSADVVPQVAATAGNVSTAATGTFRVNVGYRLPNPWMPQTTRAPFTVTATGAMTQHIVARDLFLDGSTFRKSEHVGHETFYVEREVGLILTYNRFQFGYRSLFDTKTYSTGRAHPWGSMVGGVALGR